MQLESCLLVAVMKHSMQWLPAIVLVPFSKFLLWLANCAECYIILPPFFLSHPFPSPLPLSPLTPSPPSPTHFSFVTSVHSNSGCYLSVYAIFSTIQVTFLLGGIISLAFAVIFASRALHSGILKNILRSPMSFFDTTPLGRILNRFSKDIYTVDELIPRSIQMFLHSLLLIIGAIIAILIALPTFGIVILPMGVFYLLVQVWCLHAWQWEGNEHYNLAVLWHTFTRRIPFPNPFSY